MSKLNLDLSSVETEKPRNKVDLLPAGEYEVQVIEAEVKDTAKKGAMLVIGLEVVDGNYSGAKINDRLNIVNANPTAQEIAKQRLKTIATFIGHPNPSKIVDTDELLGKSSLKAIVDVEEYEGTDGNTYKSNKIKYYTEISKAQAPKKEEAALVTSSAKRPWDKK